VKNKLDYCFEAWQCDFAFLIEQQNGEKKMTTQQKLDNIALLDFRLAGWIVNSKLMGLSDDDILKTVKKIIDVLNIVKK